MTKETFYVTTPIYYPNDKLHIGHTYTTTAADTIARFKKLQGYDVRFLTGSDEHGQKIERTAKEHNVTPKEYVDEIVSSFKDLWSLLEIDYDVFLRTTEERHEDVVQHIFKEIYEQGDIYKDKYEGWYCTPCETFWLERQLEDGKCPDCQRETEWVEEESYFFRMSKYEDDLLDYIEENPEFIQPETRRNEMVNFIKDGLEDLCISRTTFDWGIPVPIDDDHVIYVWFDALTNYLTGAGYLTNDDDFAKYWPADIHIVGKDILRFHTIIWPIILMAADLELPDRVFGHGFLTVEGGKMSKSKGNVVDPVKLVEDFGVDAVRYYLMREVAFGSDGSYSTESFIQRINSDLANDLGNLLNRTVAMVDKYFAGVVPSLGPATDHDEDLKKTAQQAIEAMTEDMENLQFSTALEQLWTLIRRTNKYIDETTPWILAKDEAKKEELGTVLYNLLESLRIIAIALKPFLIDAPEKIWQQLGIKEDIEEQSWEQVKEWGGLEAGIKVNSGDPIFPRIDIEEYFENQVEADQVEKKEDGGKDEEEVSEDYITFDDFTKLDLRVAEVLEVEKIEGSDKLLRVQVALGEEKRQLVAGIAKHYEAEELVDKKVLMVANLEPATIFGVKSNGMILAASNDEGDLTVTTVDRDIDSGAQVK
ncbi:MULTISPECIES: methionine--tRNA ligase [unclassified Candidatus Frackibacter]|uniref:methionine--tRNA ligase n=1 Tax=unclassified Candidatus Frackibacter TaxID=2648818 RepID=UPI000882B603|nr:MULTISPECIES: methionine--tRNA ligase [unclassified Candidatus Frackibacter]SDC54660.1 methionyl-tRNA synthetase [Candidatus Frackibacter sp. WG11]SEM66804.1 methionyl-tRNA synthetase [Candidatus Frackibacter sp. WG12]SFL78112.1 methionyl-tRNA synthetase [Candidatus Frackibacter sp. WG13]